jgi:hypothetical protein
MVRVARETPKQKVAVNFAAVAQAAHSSHLNVAVDADRRGTILMAACFSAD